MPRAQGTQLALQALHERLLLLQLLAQLYRARARVDLLAQRHVHQEVAQLEARAQARAQLDAPMAGAQRTQHERVVCDQCAVVPHADAQQRLARLGGEAVHGQLVPEARVKAHLLDCLRRVRAARAGRRRQSRPHAAVAADRMQLDAH